MRVTILTYGSQGDVQPFLGLATALRQAGHQPRLALPGIFQPQADAAGIPAAPLPGDIARLSQGFNQAGKNPLAMIRAMKEIIEPVAIQVASAAREACQDADLIVHTFAFTLGAHAFARQLDIPDVSVQFFPIFIASASYPQITFPALPLGVGYNRLTHHIGNGLFTIAQRLMYPRVRKAIPNAPTHLPSPFKASEGRAATALLLAYSPALVPPETDWGTHVHQTGFWLVESPIHYQPPVELVEFLENGSQPVCVGFGSMIHPKAEAIQLALLDGLRQAGQRAVILTGWDGWKAAKAGPDRLFLKSAPHAWLFPRCAAIIHHAGAGTTAAALHSGRPNLALPLAADQPFWAGRIFACGASPAPLDANHLTAAQVATTVRQALEDDSIRENALKMGKAIGRENGLDKAVEILTGLAPTAQAA